MAEQNSNPPPWTDDMSDGCTGVPDKYPFLVTLLRPCINHDRAFYYGGDQAAKDRADSTFRKETHEIAQRLTGWRKWIVGPLVHGLAEVRFWFVHNFTDGSFNWLGDGLPEDNAGA